MLTKISNESFLPRYINEACVLNIKNSCVQEVIECIRQKHIICYRSTPSQKYFLLFCSPHFKIIFSKKSRNFVGYSDVPNKRRVRLRGGPFGPLQNEGESIFNYF